MREYKDSNRSVNGTSEALTSRLNKLYTAFDQAFRVRADEEREIDTQISREVMEETGGLTRSPLTDRPETLALLSYMFLEYSRVPAMLGVDVKKRGLKYQDRTLWDKTLVEHGLEYLNRSARGNSVSVYHIKAAVSACHALAKDYKSTDWKHILSLYDRYLEFNNSVEIALERARVISRFRGTHGEIKAIEEIMNSYTLDAKHELYEQLGNLHSRLHDYKAALRCFEKASGKARSKTDKSNYRKKIEYCKMRLYYKKKYALGLSF